MNLPLFSPEMYGLVITCVCMIGSVAATLYLIRHKFKNPTARKGFVRLALFIFVPVIVYIVFYAVSNAVGRAQVESKLAEMRARGIPLDENSIFPKSPADDSDNGAYYYKAAFNLIAVTPSCDTFSKIYRKYIDSRYAEATAEWSEQDAKAVRQILAEENIKLIINLFRRGAAKPFAVYERPYNGGGTLLSELSPQRELFRLISVKSFYEGLDGNPEAGYRLLSDGFKVIVQFKSEAFAITQWVNITCATINIGGMNELTSRYGISDSSARQILAELENLDFNQAVIHGLDGEIKYCRDDFFEKIISGERERCLRFHGRDLCVMENMVLYISWICPFFYQDYAYYLGQMDKIRNLFKKTYWDCSVENEMKKIVSENNHWNYRFLAKSLTKNLIQFRTKTANIESDIDAAKLTLALHIYKNQNGAFPDKLEQLAPGILKEIPVDPISGKQFEYQKADGKFTLSSVWLKEKEQEKHKRNIQK